MRPTTAGGTGAPHTRKHPQRGEQIAPRESLQRRVVAGQPGAGHQAGVERVDRNTIAAVTEQPDDKSLSDQLEEIRTQLAWVRDYL